MAIALEIAGASRRETRTRVWSTLKRLGLGHRMEHRPRALSGGEQQRVAIARALVTDPPLLLADEPTGNLDPELARDIMDIIADANARGTTVIVATHDPGIVLCLRLVQLNRAQMVGRPLPPRGSCLGGR